MSEAGMPFLFSHPSNNSSEYLFGYFPVIAKHNHKCTIGSQELLVWTGYQIIWIEAIILFAI